MDRDERRARVQWRAAKMEEQVLSLDVVMQVGGSVVGGVGAAALCGVLLSWGAALLVVVTVTAGMGSGVSAARRPGLADPELEVRAALATRYRDAAVQLLAALPVAVMLGWLAASRGYGVGGSVGVGVWVIGSWMTLRCCGWMTLLSRLERQLPD